MPNPPSLPPPSLASLLGFVAGADSPLLLPPPTQVQTQPPLTPQPQTHATSSTNVIDVDAVTFTVPLAGGLGTATVTFPQLPLRDNTKNPLAIPQQSTQPKYNVLAHDNLIFVAFIQGLNVAAGMCATIATQVVDSSGVARPGPFVGSGAFQAFQAVVNVAAPTGVGAATGLAVGLLLVTS